MARPVFHAKLGDYFKDLRESRKLGQRQAASVASRRGLSSVSYGAINWLEAGRTKNPSAALLRGLAKLYDKPYVEIVAEVVKRAYDVDFAASDDGTLSIGRDDDDDVPEDFSAVRILTDRIAAGPALIIDEARTSGHLAFSKRWLDRLGIVRPLAIRVGQRERSMLGTINPGEVVLLDCADERRTTPKTDRIYALNVDGGSTLKRIAVVDRGLLLISDNPDKEEYPTRPIELEEDQSILDLIVGEVMWKGQPI